MDAKITKKRLSEMLSYDWLKIIGTAAALIFVWVLVFTMTATRVQPSQQFIVANYMGNVSVTSQLDAALQGDLENGKFSHEVMEVETVDLALSSDTAYQLLEARIATKELDLMFVSQEGDPNTAYQAQAEDGSYYDAYKRTYLESFAYSRSYSLHNVETYLAQMESFLKSYYTDYTNPSTLNVRKVENDFRARIKENKDKRYKKEAQIQAGIEGEKERMEKYRVAYLTFQGYLASGVVELVPITCVADDTGEVIFENTPYAINICPTGAPQAQKLSSLVGYSKSYADENGQWQTTVSAENMSVCLFDLSKDGEVFRYEGLIYVTNLLNSVLA